MTRDGWFILILLIINLILAIIYLVIHIKKDDRKRGLTNFFFFLFFPIVGELFNLLATGMGAVITFLKNSGLDLSDVSFSKERIKLPSDADIEKELNAVPIEEALIVADKSVKRKAFINVLKSDDYEDMMEQIQDAVQNDDMEVSHYAATFVADSMAKFKAEESAMRKKLNNDATTENIANYVQFMEEKLNPDVFSSVELKVYVDLFDRAASALYERDPDYLLDRTISSIVDLCYQAGESEKESLWVARAKVRYRDSLECFKICAGYYYRKGDRESLSELFNKMKRFSVPLDSEALGWIRFFKLESNKK